MATEIVYADLDLGAGERCGKRRSRPEPGTPGCPRWHRVALGAGWTGNLLLGVAVVALGSSFLRQQPGSGKIGNGNVGDINCSREGDSNSSRENVLSELREILCPSHPHGAEGCRICPQGWTLGRTECYWVSPGHSPWNKSREDCEGRGATLLLPRDRDELEHLREIVKNSTRPFWIGLWEPTAREGWMWVNGSRLDRHRFQLDLRERAGQCAMVSGSRIGSGTCGTESEWICQREAIKI